MTRAVLAPIRSVVTELAPPAGGKSARLSYTWEIDEPVLHTEVQMDLKEADGITRLDLVHTGWQQLAPQHPILGRSVTHEIDAAHVVGLVLVDLDRDYDVTDRKYHLGRSVASLRGKVGYADKVSRRRR